MQERMPCGCTVDNDTFIVVKLCEFHYGEAEKSKEPPKILNAGVSEDVKTKDGMGR